MGIVCVGSLRGVLSVALRPQPAETRVNRIVVLAVSLAIPFAVAAQPAEPFGVNDKLRFHVDAAFRPEALAGSAIYAGVLEAASFPREWGHGVKGYGREFGSTVAGSGIHSALAFGLDSALHQDPRYYRSGAAAGSGAGRDMRCAEPSSRAPIAAARHSPPGGSAARMARRFSRTSGIRTASIRCASGLIQGSVTLGFDLVSNLGAEFWPDIKRKVSSRNDDHDSSSCGRSFGLLVLFLCPDAYSYSVLTHEAIVDSTWDSAIKPLLLKRFPAATADDLTAAHAYAYGGCIIQDLGYYPVRQQVFQRPDALRPQRRLHPQPDSRVSGSRRVRVRAGRAGALRGRQQWPPHGDQSSRCRCSTRSCA